MPPENAQTPDVPAPAPGSPGSSGDPVADRRRKLQRLREEYKIDPYGGRVEGLISLTAARAQYDKAADEATKAPGFNAADDRRPTVKVAGRIVLHRDIGKLVFLTIRDEGGDLQIGVSKKSVDEQSFNLAKIADLGDIVVASGRLGTTKTGEITVWALEPSPPGRGQGEGTSDHDGLTHTNDPPNLNTPSPQPSPNRGEAAGRGGQSFFIAAKSLAPAPEKWHGLTDPELRYRKRYVDLYANPEVMRIMQLRGRIVEEIRQYLRGRGFVEVETPMMQPLAGGAAARPFETHHNALDIPLYLRIAPELYLKRLLVGGFSKVFEVNRNFRNEGISPRHNPEFTMLEAYEAFGSWETMADLVEDMICTVAQKVFGTLIIEHRDNRAPHGNVVPPTKTINLAARGGAYRW